MTAEIEWNGRSVILKEDGLWESNDSDVDRYFNSRFGSVMYPPSPAAGDNPFTRQALEAAKTLGVEIRWRKQETEDDTDRDRVY